MFVAAPFFFFQFNNHHLDNHNFQQQFPFFNHNQRQNPNPNIIHPNQEFFSNNRAAAASAAAATRNQNDLWKMFIPLIFPLILSMITFGEIDFALFVPVFIVLAFTTDNPLSRFIAGQHPSLLILLLVTLPAFFEKLYMSSPLLSSDGTTTSGNLHSVQQMHEEIRQRHQSHLANTRFQHDFGHANRNQHPGYFPREDLGGASVGIDSTVVSSMTHPLGYTFLTGLTGILFNVSLLLISFTFSATILVMLSGNADVVTMLPGFVQRFIFWLLETFHFLNITDFFGDVTTANTNRIGTVPSSKKALEAIKKSTYSITEGDLLHEQCPYITCSICLEEMRLQERGIVKLGCKHIFHVNCVVPWLAKKCTCPSCRYELETDNLIYEFYRKKRLGSQACAPTYFAEPIINTEIDGISNIPPSSVNLEQLSIADLKSLAKKKNIDLTGLLEKSEILKAIQGT